MEEDTERPLKRPLAEDSQQIPASAEPMGAGDAGAMIEPPGPEEAEERLELGLPDSLGGPVLPGGDTELSGNEDAPE